MFVLVLEMADPINRGVGGTALVTFFLSLYCRGPRRGEDDTLENIRCV